MARALVVFLLLAASLAAPAAAPAQENPFGPLPPAPQATPAPTQPPPAPGQDDVSRETLFAIAGGVLAVFFLIGWYITRDARRNLTEDDRRRVDRERRHERPAPEGRRGEDPKRRARQKAKAQRRARRAQRRR